MARLIVLWTQPHHLTAEQAEGWAREQVEGLLALDAVRRADLTPLQSASPRHPAEWDWLLELEIDGPARDCVERGPCGEWLGDMRLLGMRPIVLLVGPRPGEE